MQVTILNQQSRKVDCVRLERVACGAMKAEGCHPQATLSVVIGDNAWIQVLNERYTGRQVPTDVLAFPQDITPEGEDPLLGDVALSAETAEWQAREEHHSLMRELEILLVHGILHLTGWEDDTPPRQRRMMRRTLKILSDLEGTKQP